MPLVGRGAEPALPFVSLGFDADALPSLNLCSTNLEDFLGRGRLRPVRWFSTICVGRALASNRHDGKLKAGLTGETDGRTDADRFVRDIKHEEQIYGDRIV